MVNQNTLNHLIYTPEDFERNSQKSTLIENFTKRLKQPEYESEIEELERAKMRDWSILANEFVGSESSQ